MPSFSLYEGTVDDLVVAYRKNFLKQQRLPLTFERLTTLAALSRDITAYRIRGSLQLNKAQTDGDRRR